MSRRTFLNGFTLFTDQDSASAVSAPETQVQGLDMITYYLNVDSTVDGQIKFFACNDPVFNSNGFYLDFGQTLTVDGSAETEFTFIIENTGFKWLRMDWVPNTSTGDLVNASVSGVAKGA